MTFATYRSTLIIALLTAACIAGTGCVSRDKTDLEDYVTSVLQRPGGRIDPLPPIKPYEAYLYQSGELGLRNPFRSFFDIERAKQKLEPNETDEGQKALLTEMLTHNAEDFREQRRIVGNYPRCRRRRASSADRQLHRYEFWKNFEYPGGQDRPPRNYQGLARTLGRASRNLSFI
jgi:hypothetical protein